MFFHICIHLDIYAHKNNVEILWTHSFQMLSRQIANFASRKVPELLHTNGKVLQLNCCKELNCFLILYAIMELKYWNKKWSCLF